MAASDNVFCWQPLDVRFIEYMPFDGNKWSMSKFVPYRSMLAQVMARWPQLLKRQDSPNDTSKVRLNSVYSGSFSKWLRGHCSSITGPAPLFCIATLVTHTA